MNEITRSSIASGFMDLPMQGGLGQGVSSGFSLIGFKGKMWSLRHQGETYYFTRTEDDTPMPYIDVVILEENPNVSKTYYPQGTYTEDAANQPTCSAVNGDVPDPGVPIPQSQTCGTCKRNVWTVLQTGGKGQECKNNKRVAVLLMPAMTEKLLGAPLDEPVLLRVPSASLRSLKAYGDGLRHRGIHSAAVVTRISFDRVKQFQMNFVTQQPLTNAEVPVIKDLLANPLTSIILGTQAPIQQIEQRPKREERVETGILAAFGREQSPAEKPQVGQGQVTAIKPRGRPPGSQNKPKPSVETIEAQVVADLSAQAAATVDQQQGSLPWDEADDQLDDTLKKVMASKIQSMLPK